MANIETGETKLKLVKIYHTYLLNRDNAASKMGIKNFWSYNATDRHGHLSITDIVKAGDVSKTCCAECICKLKKCLEFQKCCIFALEKIKTWKKQAIEVRKPITLLHEEMPGSQLSLRNKNNHKVYFFQSADLYMPTNTQISITNNTNIAKDNIPKGRNIKKLNSDVKSFIECADEKNQTLEEVKIFDVKSEHDNIQSVIETSEDEELESDYYTTDNSISDFETENFNDDNADYESDALTGLGNSLNLPNKTETLKMANIKISEDTKHACKRKLEADYYSEHVKIKQEDDVIDAMKIKLREKLEKHGYLFYIIDIDIVLNHLKEVKYIDAVKEACLGPGPLNNFAIMQLLKLQDTVMYGDTFDTFLLQDPNEIKAQFEKCREFADYYKSNQYRCEICITGFKYSKRLEHHMKTAHNPELPFECPTCHQRNATYRGMIMHARAHEIVHKCKFCNFTTAWRSTIILHANHHRRWFYNCKNCYKKFILCSNLFAHITKAHVSNHICQFCAATFRTSSSLDVHNKLEHNNIIKFVKSEDNKKCEECNVIFISEHIYNVHVEESCPTRMMVLNKQSNAKFGDQKKNKLACVSWVPGRNEKGGNYLCPICGIRKTKPCMIEVHIRKHTGVRPFACSMCPKTYMDKSNLQEHLQRHYPPNFECNVCGKKFHTSSGLYTHNLIHKNDRKHVCHICGKGFVLPASLRGHVSSVHLRIRRIRKSRRKNKAEKSNNTVLENINNI